MGKIYKDQTYLSIIIDTGVDIQTATVKKIKYIDPSGTPGEVVGTLNGTTKIKYDFTTTNTLKTAGSWIFWSFVVFSDGRSASGTPIEIIVYEPGS
jgi:hypothetical protein